jgi:hypothetical protein
MPRGDGTGPAGWGPMTGRSAGYCAGYGVPGYTNPGVGFGGGWGRGRGFGFRRRTWRQAPYGPPPGWVGPAYGPAPGWDSPMAADDEVSMLKQQADYLERSLDQIRKRMDELDSQDTGESE